MKYPKSITIGFVMLILLCSVHLLILYSQYSTEIADGTLSLMIVFGNILYYIPAFVFLEIIRLVFRAIRVKFLPIKCASCTLILIHIVSIGVLIYLNYDILYYLWQLPILWNLPVDILLSGVHVSFVILVVAYLIDCLVCNTYFKQWNQLI